MTSEQLQMKLGLLPLLTVVNVEDGLNELEEPAIIVYYDAIPGPGTTTLTISLTPDEAELKTLANNLPMLAQHQLAALAILITPPLDE